MKKICLISLGLMAISAGCGQTSITSQPLVPAPDQTASSTVSDTTSKLLLASPINNALDRITKKPFGIKISPSNSPVSPEKFSGYHTGADFETTPAEQNVDIPIFSACNGKILLKKYASGYGGVLVESCNLNEQSITVIYGHLRLVSIEKTVGEQLTTGEQIGVLGQGYSTETDGERKHLHFGIHKGTSINILGYVKSQAELSSWLNPIDYLK